MGIIKGWHKVRKGHWVKLQPEKKVGSVNRVKVYKGKDKKYPYQTELWGSHLKAGGDIAKFESRGITFHKTRKEATMYAIKKLKKERK